MRTVALDVHKENLVLCEVSEGKVLDRARGRTLEDLIHKLGPDTPPARVAFEACRSAWYLYDRLQAWGHIPIILDTTRIRMMGVGQHGRKNDALDAEAMARALDKGYVHAAHVLSPNRREMRRLLAIRFGFVSARTQHINLLRGLALSEGVNVASCDADQFVRHARAASWPSASAVQIEPTLRLIEQLTQSIHDSTQMLYQVCSQEPVVVLLATAPYIGLIGAATFISVIDEAGRFLDAHQVASYLGLVPSETTSNSAPRLGSITKEGNPWARMVLVEAAWGLLSKGDPADPLVAWGRMVAERRNKFIGAVAIARRLAGILWAMWKYQRPYDPQRLACASSAGLQKHAARIEAQSESIRHPVPQDTVGTAQIQAAHKKLRAAFVVKRTTRGRQPVGGVATK